MRYLVPLDGSKGSEDAFSTVLSMIDSKVDHLFLLTIVEDLSYMYDVGPEYSYVPVHNDTSKKAKQILLSFGQKIPHIPHTLLMTTATHVGDAICQTAKVKKVEYIVMGSRGLGTVMSLLLGSVSKYCSENAPCSVIVVRKPPEELHSSKTEVQQLEEEERKRRIAEGNPHVTQQHQLNEEVHKLSEAVEKWKPIAEDISDLSASEKLYIYEFSH